MSSKYSGRATGMTFMTAFGVIWLFFDHQSISIGLLVLPVVCVLVLVVACVYIFVMAQKLPAPTEEEERASEAEGKKIGWRFGLVFGAEGLLILISVNLLPALGLASFIVPVIAIIVGVHFIPLAGLFKAPVYYITGLISVVIAVVAMFIDTLSVRQDFTCFGMCLVLWITAGYVFLVARKEMKAYLTDKSQ